MAKKVSKTSSKKNTTKRAGTKKKAGSSSARSAKKAPAKKTPRKTTTKKVTTKKVTKKNVTKKKVTKKAPAIKTTTKKTPAKKTSKKTVKKTTSKKAPTKKADTKTSTTKKTTRKSARTSKKSSSKKTSKKTSSAEAPRFRRAFSSSHDEGMEAAKRLASAAGLSDVSRASAEAEKAKSYRRVKKSPFKPDQLAEFREMLILKRRQLVGDVSSMETEALSSSEFSSHTPNHMADQGSDTYDQSLNLDLAASQRTIMNDIDAALMRIESGTYGICELLGKPIKSERLRNTPWARFSIEAARMIEDDPSLLKRLDD